MWGKKNFFTFYFSFSLNSGLGQMAFISGISDTTKQSGETDTRIVQMSKEISGFAKTMSVFITTFNELSAKSGNITASLVSLKEQSSAVKTSYAQMIEMTEKLAKAMRDLSELSKR
jgi:methyl-accepting chemotaxis protein